MPFGLEGGGVCWWVHGWFRRSWWSFWEHRKSHLLNSPQFLLAPMSVWMYVWCHYLPPPNNRKWCFLMSRWKPLAPYTSDNCLQATGSKEHLVKTGTSPDLVSCKLRGILSHCFVAPSVSESALKEFWEYCGIRCYTLQFLWAARTLKDKHHISTGLSVKLQL